MKIHPVLLWGFGAAILALAFLVRHTFFRSSEKSVEDFNPRLSFELVNKGDALLIDVRTLGEFREGHVPGAVHIPYDEIPKRVQEIRQHVKDASASAIVVYCRSGRRSAVAKETLESLGFQRVVNHGGIDSWQSKK